MGKQSIESFEKTQSISGNFLFYIKVRKRTPTFVIH